MLTSYKLGDRFKELSSFAGVMVILLGTVLPQLASAATVFHILVPVAAIIGAMLFFMPENRTVITADHVFGALVKMLPPSYRVPVPDVPVPVVPPASPAPATAVARVAAMLLLGLLAMGLTACGSGSTIAGLSVPPAPTTPSQALYEAETAFDLAIKQANVYAALPRCGTGAPAVCSDLSTIQTLNADAQKGAQALGAAKALLAVYLAATAPTASQTTALSAAINTLVDDLTPMQTLLATLKVS